MRNKADHSLDQSFWNKHWKNRNTGWDIGYASPPITEYMEQYAHKEAAILIPGCGNAYEAEYLAEHGFTDITLIDIAPRAVERANKKFAEAPEVTAICANYFEYNGARYDLIIEQTFFCAISPDQRKAYAQKAANLLHQGGKIAGVLFDEEFDRQGPPFGGHPKEYRSIFEPYFSIKQMEACYNSIPPRAGSEVFITFVKK